MLASESRFHFGPPSAAKTTSHKALAQHTSCTVPSHHAGLCQRGMHRKHLEGGMRLLVASPVTLPVPRSTHPAPQEEREDYPGVRAANLGAHLPPGAGPRAQKEPARRVGCKGDA